MKCKEISIFLLTVLLAGLVSGCAGSPTKSKEENDKIRIIATSFPPYDFARQIAGDAAQVSMLLAPGQESHSFEPTPQDIAALTQADLFIMGGGKSDEWAKKLAKSANLGAENTLSMMDNFPILPETYHAHETDDHSENYAYDEHVWTSPAGAMEICKKIADALCVLSPENSQIFMKNLDEYLKKLEALDNEFWYVVESSPKKTLIFGDRFPFHHFAQRYGLSYYSAFPGCAGETEPIAATMKLLIDKVKEEKIPVVLHIELSNTKIAEAICEATGAKPMLFHACHGVTKDELDRGETYLSLMEQNVAVLKEALS